MVVWDGNVGDQRETYWFGWTSRDLQRKPGAQRGRWSAWDVAGGHGDVSGKPLLLCLPLWASEAGGSRGVAGLQALNQAEELDME